MSELIEMPGERVREYYRKQGDARTLALVVAKLEEIVMECPDCKCWVGLDGAVEILKGLK